MPGQSRREFLRTAGLLGVAAGMAGDASAQPVEGPWEVNIRWHDRAPVKVTWTLNGDGTFSSSDGYSGTWTQSGSLLLFSVRSDTHPAFAGIARGRSIQSGLALQPGGVRGFWSAHLLP
ncbi:MAG TPA: twin-arginine translocation signal domain-containing protein [Thermoanaerobaculia bacterium]|jgi:hypothetical protein|nr:twin-arginine translocation signal domain-containing protein [Thermoanaerobaculia bacterium]